MENLWIYGIWSTFIYYSWDIWCTLFHGFSTLSTFPWGYLMIFDGLFHGKTHHFLSISRRCGAATRRSPWLHHPRRARWPRWPRWPAAGGTFQRLLRLIEYSWKMIFLYNIMQLQSLDIFHVSIFFFHVRRWMYEWIGDDHGVCFIQPMAQWSQWQKWFRSLRKQELNFFWVFRCQHHRWLWAAVKMKPSATSSQGDLRVECDPSWLSAIKIFKMVKILRFCAFDAWKKTAAGEMLWYQGVS